MQWTQKMKHRSVKKKASKKFISKTSFLSNKKDLDNFESPSKLLDAIDTIIFEEFINCDPDHEFFTPNNALSN